MRDLTCYSFPEETDAEIINKINSIAFSMSLGDDPDKGSIEIMRLCEKIKSINWI